MAIQVRVRNFQSIEDAEILIDGLTVVTGTNNAGKSAFFRALRGAVTNTRGHAFVRHGKGHSTVDIKFDDDKTLTWKKGKGVNTYIVNGEELPKVGHGVPPEARIFGIDSVVAGKAELWPQIAPQITGVSFLLHEPGSVIAEAVADVKRVNQLSRALSACEKDRRAARSQLKVRRSDAKTLAEKAEGFTGLDDVVEVIDVLEKHRKKAETVKKALTNLGKLQRSHKKAQEAVTALEGVEEVQKALPDQMLVESAQKDSQGLREVLSLQTQYTAVRIEVSALEGLEEVGYAVPSSERMKKAQSVASGLRGARKLCGRYQDAAVRVAALEGLEEAHKALPSDARIQYAQQFRKGVQVSVELAMRYESARKELGLASSAQEALSGIGLGEKLVVRAGKFKKARGNAVGLRDRYRKSKKTVLDLNSQIAEQQEELERLSESLVHVLGSVEECPTCGGGLDHVH